MAVLVEHPGPLAEDPRHRHFRALVVLADAASREAVVRSLQTIGARDVAEAASIGEGRVRARTSGPRELVITEGTLPDGSGTSLLAELRSNGWRHGVVLSALEDPYTVRAALAAGVRSFLVVRPPAEASLAPAIPLQGRPRGAEGLSTREIEVLKQVADGRSNRDIGIELGLSALTVKSHLARISRKLGTGDRAEMVVLALRAGVID